MEPLAVGFTDREASMRRTLISALLSSITLFHAGLALAQSRGIPADRLDKPRIDGMLKDWPGSATSLGETLKGKPDARVGGMIGYDDKALYLAFEVKDSDFVSTPAHKNGEDHGTVLLEIPQRGGGRAAYEIEVFPGKPGKSEGVIEVNGKRPAGSEVVEAVDDEGYILEARLPWGALPAAARLRVGMRAELRFTDAKAPGSVSGVVTTRKQAVLTESELSLKQGLLEPNNLKAFPDREAIGNVWGDGMYERVAIFGGYMAIVGSHYKQGKEFYYKDLQMPDSSLVTRFELRDMNGDGKEEIILQRRTGANTYREIFEILTVNEEGVADRACAHEVAIVTDSGRIENEVKIVSEGKHLAAKISEDKAEGFEEDSFREPPHEGMESALLPWGASKSHTLSWDGSSCTVDKEAQSDSGKGSKKGKHAKKSSRARDKVAAEPASSGAPGGEAAPPPPRAPSSDELLDQVYALYRKERGKDKSAPRFDFVTDVAGDGELERVLVHDKDVVVFGKGYRSGRSFAYTEIGLVHPEDVLDVTARDLTGDGKAEIIVRGVKREKAGKELKDEAVTRHVLFVYQISEQGLTRVFAAETGRSMGDKHLLGAVRFTPEARGVAIELLPGRAAGWSEKSYPFPQDQGPVGNLEPLILPWTGGKKRYVFSGSGFVQK